MGKNYLTNELDRVSWVEDLPGGCDVELEICVADDYAEFEDFVSPPAFFGPTGGGNFTTPAGESLPSGKTGRYAMVRATLTGTGSATPTLSDIQLTCNAGSDTGSRVIRNVFDEAGNILKITTIDDLGVTEDVRDDDGWSAPDRMNSMNQIMRQDVGGDTWTFSYDDNGNMTGKTNGVDTWTYTWDTLYTNQLIRVQGPGGVDVAYSYDYFGRMISRDDGLEVTTFVWDQFDCIRETTGMSTTTYCIPEGVLTSFIRDGDRYDVHCDALASVRMVTDGNGDVVLRREYDAWGSELAGSFDYVPGGFDYGFVGGAGCRKDPETGLVYMRARHYDPKIQRFVSKDPMRFNGGLNLLTYSGNNPTLYLDPYGKVPITNAGHAAAMNAQRGSNKPSEPSGGIPGWIPALGISAALAAEMMKDAAMAAGGGATTVGALLTGAKALSDAMHGGAGNQHNKPLQMEDGPRSQTGQYEIELPPQDPPEEPKAVDCDPECEQALKFALFIWRQRQKGLTTEQSWQLAKESYLNCIRPKGLPNRLQQFLGSEGE